MKKTSFTYDYPRPALTVDTLLFQYRQGRLNLLLIKRKDDPYKDCWAFPGGFVEEGETVEAAVVRELHEETGLVFENLEQVYTASAIGRDPRGWTVSVIFLGFTTLEKDDIIAGDDAAEVEWHPFNELPNLAFDHKDIVDKIIEIVRHRIKQGELICEMLPGEFTEDELHNLYNSFYNNKNVSLKVIEELKCLKIIKESGGEGRYFFT